MTQSPAFATCPNCGEEYPNSGEGYRWHLGTFAHQAGELGEAGRALRDAVLEVAKQSLRRLRVIR